MTRLCSLIFFTVAVMLAQLNLANAQNYSRADAGWTVDTVPYLISPPEKDGPIKLEISFELYDIANISDADATFDFTGMLKLTWMDPRNAFDPDVSGVKEKTYSGYYQFDELSPRWYPQVVLLNEAYHYEANAILSKIQPDGTTSVFQAINASARTQMDLTYYPYDSQKIRVKFGMFGYDVDQIIFEAKDIILSPNDLTETVDEWTTNSINFFVGTKKTVALGANSLASTFTIDVDVTRKSAFVVRTVIVPLLLVVLLTFSVFWIEIKSIEERLNVSFFGLLTISAYQLVVGDHLPHVAYFNLIQGVVFISLVAICLAVFTTLFMGKLIDAHPKLDAVNTACKWFFPLFYLLSLLTMYLTLTPLSALSN